MNIVYKATAACVLLALLAACQGTGNDAPMAKAAGAVTLDKGTFVGADITDTSYQTPAGNCPQYIGTSKYDQLCWPAPGGNVILVPIEYPWYYEASPPGVVTVTARIN